ncbi:MAG: hypothetical protein NC433_01855 [Clostridiales bacterium]|nr:hypothetical protein [Clostridiales bacterium]
MAKKKIINNIPRNERTFKNSRNELLAALSDGRFIAISDYSSEYVNNHDFKLIIVNTIGETVCLEVFKRKVCLLEHINNDDWETKFKIEANALDGEELNYIIKKSTRKNTSTRIFAKRFLANIVKAWDLDKNKLEMQYKSDLINGIRSTVNATIGYANKGLYDIITDTPNMPDFVCFENEKGDMKSIIRLKEDETVKDRFEISIIKSINNHDTCYVFIAKRVEDKFVFDEEAYKNEPEHRKGVESLIEQLNFDLKSPTNHVFIEANKWIFKEYGNIIIADKIFDFKKSFTFHDEASINAALRQAESDGIDKLEALYKNGLLGKFVEKDKIFSEKEFPEKTIKDLSDKEKTENSKSNIEQGIEQSLGRIGLSKLDLNRLRTEIDIYENRKLISDLISSISEDIEELKESKEQVSNEALEEVIPEENVISKENEEKEIAAAPEEQRLEIDNFVNKVGKSPDEIYSTLKANRKELSQEMGYQYLVDNVKEGEKLIGIKKDIMQESLRLRAENADNLQDLDLSKNEAETFLLSDTYANISEKTADEKIEILKEINSHIEESDGKTDENEHNEDTMRSIYFKVLEIEMIKDLVKDLDTKEENPKELEEILTGSRMTRIKDYINEKETFYSLSDDEKETLEKMKEIVDKRNCG